MLLTNASSALAQEPVSDGQQEPVSDGQQEPVSDGQVAHQDFVDDEARAVFRAGTAAFADARYQDALDYFRRAHELSGRALLLYNIGLAADRLGRNEEALEAMERFVESEPDHQRRREADARIETLRMRIEREGSAQASPPPAPDRSPDALTVLGAGALVLVGAAGVTAAVIAIAAGDECVDAISDMCVRERTTNWGAVGLYGGLGVAAIAGAIVLLAIGLGNDDEQSLNAQLRPMGLVF